MEEIINEYYAERKGNYIYVDRDDGQSGDEQGTDERHLNEYEQSEKGMYDSNVDGDEVEGHKNMRIRDNGSQIDGGSGRNVKNIFSLSEPVEEKGNAKYLLKLYVEVALPNKGGEAFSRAYELKDIKEIATIPEGVLSENGDVNHKIAAQLAQDVEALEQYEKLWVDALKAAVKNNAVMQSNVKENTDTESSGGVKYSIGVLDNGDTYVIADRNVITGNDRNIWRKQITDFFNNLLEQNKSIDIYTLNGDILTISKKITGNKSRDDSKYVSGIRVLLSDEEFALKLRVASHIDEIAETSVDKQKKKHPDYKNHSFAKDGFSYRTAYFEDFDGNYYEVVFSVGHDNTIATIYNVGKIKKDTLPSAKLIAVVGSKPLGRVSNGIVSQPPGIVNLDTTNSPSPSLSKKKAMQNIC